MSLLLILPIMLPMATAILTGLVRDRVPAVQVIAGLGAILQLMAALLLLVGLLDVKAAALWIGSWPAPFGICLVADYLSGAMVLITAVIHAAVTVYSIRDITADQVRSGFHPLLCMLTGAICGAFLTGDLFNLYVWFEVMLMASFGLLVMGNRACQLTGAVKYVAINLISTLLFITAIGIIYGLTGTLNLADLHTKIAGVTDTALLNGAAMLLMLAFAIKAALFPLFFWLPASYHTLPVAVSAYFAGMLSKVGIYALLRVFTLVFGSVVSLPHAVLVVIAALTMLFGVVGAAAQMEVRRILSFHIISQVGYMALGIALLTPLALAGAIVYLIHHIIVKANLFLVSGLIRQGAGTLHLPRIGGFYRSHGLVALAFFIPAFALAGFPPLSGFWAKLLIIKAALDIERYGLAILAALVGLLTVLSMVKIWSEAFLKPAPADHPAAAPTSFSPWMLVPVLTLAAFTVVLGLFMEPVFRFSLYAAEQLLDPHQYLQAVWGGGR
ncbi:proton-conducting transporter transmembrane domain-containing protein [Desulfofustis limnaeus]|uniref:NADH dehydrogenase n=1 Tax=Desulfofustis limnaeus TaxID=2740163 RepID=A0ABM7W6D4_9BACT|nr:proton-conducting transporter membrane subunit [Desulfofustis limnaeus]MDX9894811.1 proton-conducting transporter membrane subunit [Desulfofustis sp.]BDD86501.1 NADH dehydrogenase [Desulfofustis limnaeus]